MGYPLQNDRWSLLRLDNICLNYGNFSALRNMNLSLGYGEVHALVGERGSGKSSLSMLVRGMQRPTSGVIAFDGISYRSLTPKLAHKLGIALVHQQTPSLTDCFTVAENFFLIKSPFHRLTWNRKKLDAVRSFFSQYEITIDASSLVADLNLSDRIFLDILKYLYTGPKLLILDEVLKKLSPPALKKIVGILQIFRRRGMSILFISGKIDDVHNIADRVSIIKHGEILLTDDVENIGKVTLLKMAYMQISEEEGIGNLNKEFYQLLKYNEAILRNLPVNLIAVDNTRRIKLVNTHCKQHFEFKETSYFNIPLEHFFSSSNDEAFEMIDKAFSSKDVTTFYQVPMTFNQITVITNLKIFPIYDESFLLGHIIILEDVTEYDRLQKQVVLSEKLASVGLLAAGVAHEINNPLEMIYNSLTYLKYHIHGEELEEAIDDIQEEMTSIADIVSNLHSFSDNKLGDDEEVEVNELLQGILNLIKFHARDKQISIHFEAHAGELSIQANKNELKQVLLNLFKNSFEAMPSGGDIFIETAPIEQEETQRVQVRFKDTGSGIDDKNPDNIFLPFYSTKKSAQDNMGLGLSVSYGIIKKYHGTISVENIAGAGCQFLIQFPRSL